MSEELEIKPNVDRRCGTCKWWKEPKDINESHYGHCAYKILLPLCATGVEWPTKEKTRMGMFFEDGAALLIEPMADCEGTDCPTWAAKENHD